MTSTTIQQQRKGRRARHIPHICLSLQQTSGSPQNATHYLYLRNANQEKDTIMSQQANQIRNRLRGTIRSIFEGKLLSEVVLDTCAGPVTSVVNTNLIRSQNLMPGSEVIALIPATEVALSRT